MKFRAIFLGLVAGLFMAHTPAYSFGKLSHPGTPGDEKAKEKEILPLEEVARQKVMKGDAN